MRLLFDVTDQEHIWEGIGECGVGKQPFVYTVCRVITLNREKKSKSEILCREQQSVSAKGSNMEKNSSSLCLLFAREGLFSTFCPLSPASLPLLSPTSHRSPKPRGSGGKPEALFCPGRQDLDSSATDDRGVARV